MSPSAPERTTTNSPPSATQATSATQPPPSSASGKQPLLSPQTRPPSSPAAPPAGPRPCVGQRTLTSPTRTTTPRRRLHSPSPRSSAGAPQRVSPPQQPALSRSSCRQRPRMQPLRRPRRGERGAGAGRNHATDPLRGMAHTARCARSSAPGRARWVGLQRRRSYTRIPAHQYLGERAAAERVPDHLRLGERAPPQRRRRISLSDAQGWQEVLPRHDASQQPARTQRSQGASPSRYPGGVA